MTMQLVNGIICLNCTDVERAKKLGLGGSAKSSDPLHPSSVISSNGTAIDGADGTTSGFGPSSTSSLSSIDPPAPANGQAGLNPSNTVTPDTATSFGTTQPLSRGDRGTRLNIAI